MARLKRKTLKAHISKNEAQQKYTDESRMKVAGTTRNKRSK